MNPVSADFAIFVCNEKHFISILLVGLKELEKDRSHGQESKEQTRNRKNRDCKHRKNGADSKRNNNYECGK